MVQLPSAPSDSGNSRSTAAAASCAFANTTPASQVMVLEAAIDLADPVEPREREDQFAVDAESVRRPGRYCRPAAPAAFWSRWRA